MKNITLIAAIAMMTFTGFLKASEYPTDLQAKGCCKKRCIEPSGSYYADITSQNPLQQLILTNNNPPQFAIVQFSGTNANGGVTLLSSGKAIVVPKKGYYEIDWNASLSMLENTIISYHFSLLKNGVTLLHPEPQAAGAIFLPGFVQPFTSAAASVIVPLLAGDEISLVLTIDGVEGFGNTIGLQIESAQISAHFVSDSCN